MTTPATFTDPAREAQGLEGKTADAYEKGVDADMPTDTAHTSNLDIEKGAQSAAMSTNSDDRTLAGEVAPETERDPDIVDWDGPDDPENPLNWPAGRKWGLIAILGAVTLVT